MTTGSVLINKRYTSTVFPTRVVDKSLIRSMPASPGTVKPLLLNGRHQDSQVPIQIGISRVPFRLPSHGDVSLDMGSSCRPSLCTRVHAKRARFLRMRATLTTGRDAILAKAVAAPTNAWDFHCKFAKGHLFKRGGRPGQGMACNTAVRRQGTSVTTDKR